MRKGVWMLVGIILIVVIALILSLLEIFPEEVPSEKESQEIQGSFPSSTMKLDLFISRPPPLGETAKITAVITYVVSIKEGKPRTSANITLPEGLELISGNLTWEGELVEKVNFSITVKSVKVGNWTIEGRARNPPTGETHIGGINFIYLSVMEDTATISDIPFREEGPCPKGFNCGTTYPPRS